MDKLNKNLSGIFNNAKHASVFRCVIILMLAFAAFPTTSANAETRKLKLYYLHTGERAEITYKRNGKYIKSGLKKINHFLRDWRRNEPTKMNPRLLDLIWEVYKETRSRKHIHVISGYRSPKTNNLLRKRGRGVAKKSQHTLGNALDFFIPGVNLKKLRDIGLRKGLGGVGYYPRSGSPFVHMDTGRVRHWPRMNRRELVKVFPKGKTLHVPTDGKPLPGYNVAKANYERKLKGGSKFSVASAEEIRKKPNLLRKLFGREDEDEGAIGAVSAPKAVRTKPVKTKKPKAVAKPVDTPELPTPIVPEPIAPEPVIAQTPEVVLAALSPNQVPVPLLAPRIAIVKPPEPEVVEPAIAEPEIVDTQVASLEADETQAEQEETLITTASAIPVPSLRPAIEPETPIVLAETIEQSPVPRPTVEVTALSSNEISDLRQQVYATLEREVKAPAPVQVAETIPFKPATNVGESNPFAPPTQLETSDVASLIQSASSAINNQITITEPIEPGTQNTGAVATPTEKPGTLLTALLPTQAELSDKPIALIEEPAATIVANIPVPVRATRPTIKPVVKLAEKSKSAKKALSKKEFKQANLDKRLAVNAVLATDASIKDIAKINPPAYGKNIIRTRPTTVLAQGFTLGQLNSNTQGFSGSSLEFLDFIKVK